MFPSGVSSFPSTRASFRPPDHVRVAVHEISVWYVTRPRLSSSPHTGTLPRGYPRLPRFASVMSSVFARACVPARVGPSRVSERVSERVSARRSSVRSPCDLRSSRRAVVGRATSGDGEDGSSLVSAPPRRRALTRSTNCSAVWTRLSPRPLGPPARTIPSRPSTTTTRARRPGGRRRRPPPRPRRRSRARDARARVAPSSTISSTSGCVSRGARPCSRRSPAGARSERISGRFASASSPWYPSINRHWHSGNRRRTRCDARTTSAAETSSGRTAQTCARWETPRPHALATPQMTSGC